jgi:hypothetical protein
VTRVPQSPDANTWNRTAANAGNRNGSTFLNSSSVSNDNDVDSLTGGSDTESREGEASHLHN